MTRRMVALDALLAGMLLALPCAFGLNPALDVNQFNHKAWKVREGFAKGTIYRIAQTPDGYLWLGTDNGLFRFDGVRAVAWEPIDPLPSGSITSLLVGRDGTLWIGTYKGLVSWKDGRLTNYRELAGRAIFRLLQDREGTVWVGTGVLSARLCAIQKQSIVCHGEDGSLGIAVLSLYEDRQGNLWAGSSTGLWRWKPGPVHRYPVPGGMSEIQDLIEGDNGALWLSLQQGIGQLVDGKVVAYPFPETAVPFRPLRMLRDREGGLWIGTSAQGLVHVHRGRIDVFTSTDGLSGDAIGNIFEDREGNIWVTTSNGLDRFRDVPIPAISFLQGLSRALLGAVVAAKDGSVWIATFDGLDRWSNGQVTIYRKRRFGRVTSSTHAPAAREVIDPGLPDNSLASLYCDERGRIWVSSLGGFAYFEDGRFVPVPSLPGGIVNAIAGDAAGSLWVANQQLGLFHWSSGVVEQIPWTKLARAGWARALLTDPSEGGLWLGFSDGGVAYWKDGQVRAWYTASDGLAPGRVNGLRLTPDGALWAATEGGLSRWKDGRWVTLGRSNGLPCDGVHWALDDDADSSWLYTPCGLLRISRPELDAWAAEPGRTVKATVFDNSDGVTIRSIPGGYTPQVAKSIDGKLWFSTWDYVNILDPAYLPTNSIPPPVHIEQVTADHKPYPVTSGLSLPPLVRDLQIDYTGLNLAAPEGVRFRYKLEGRDRDWQDVGTRRQAFFNDLKPRKYRFRVIASNNSGVWNEAGASLDFSIDPKFYQTGWFLASCLAVFLGMLWVSYCVRLRYLAAQFNMRLDERVNERTRIARDLHDTLLQSFQGVLLKFHAVTFALPDRPAEARKNLEKAIEEARAAIAEGRDAVQGLRSSTVLTEDIARAITTLGEGLTAEQGAGSAPRFYVYVEGTSRRLAPILRDEVYRLAAEALRNAFRHAAAKRIEVSIHYDKREFTLRVRDDGKGIDPKVLSEGGRSGHHGLPGMQERAKLVGGKLAVWSELDAGTEIELTVSGAIAYAKAPAAAPQSNRAEKRN